jgi:molybdopterin-guanine dinucleotide biosynthesis protein A
MNCYVLIGGRSRRMRRSKVELFGERVTAAARGAFDQVISVQRRGGEPFGDTIFEAKHADEAPIFGVARALEHAEARCFVLAVDYPLITTEVLRFLRGRAEASEAPLVVPECRGQAQTLCASYDRPMLPLIEARIASHKYDLRGFLHLAEVIAVGDELTNVNTPEELQQIDERVLASR